MSSNNPEKAFLSTQGYRGTRDFFPEDQRLKKYIYNKVHSVLKSFGYEEYDGPFLEHFELYAAKSSEEIVREQLYSFVDKGERHLAIRPEMTPTLARMIASKHRELLRPIRWYSIPTCMRFERPQRGRLREFDQLNVDVFGGNPVDEDIEILLTICEIIQSLGGSSHDFIIKLNHRGIVNSFLHDILKIKDNNIASLLRLLDKCDKISKEEFYQECKNFHLTSSQISQIENFLKAEINEIINLLGNHPQVETAFQMKTRIETINQLTNSHCARFSTDIMRGFDYYTGMIFEVFDTHPDNRRALCGGGRYDNLVGAFGTDELPGVGFGMGDVALVNFIQTHNLIPELKKETQVAVLRFNEQDRLHALKLAAALRKLNLNVEACISNSKFGKQIQNAEKVGVKAVAFCGEDEIKNNTFAVKWLQTGKQDIYNFNEEGLNLFYKGL